MKEISKDNFSFLILADGPKARSSRALCAALYYVSANSRREKVESFYYCLK